jgi:hypothetical protein
MNMQILVISCGKMSCDKSAVYIQITIIIYRPGARGFRQNITQSDDISRGALPRGKYHH